MGKIGWIWILVFVVLPIIQRVMEAKKQARHRSRHRGQNLARAQRKKQLEEEVEPSADEGWIQAGKEPATSAQLQEIDMGGGWVAVADPVTVRETVPAKPSSPLVTGEAASKGGGGHLEVLTEQLARWGVEIEAPQEEENPYLIDRDAHDEFHKHQSAGAIGQEIIRKSLATAPPRTTANYHGHKQDRWKLTRSQLQNRLLWSEILGPPICLRPPDSR